MAFVAPAGYYLPMCPHPPPHPQQYMLAHQPSNPPLELQVENAVLRNDLSHSQRRENVARDTARYLLETLTADKAAILSSHRDKIAELEADLAHTRRELRRALKGVRLDSSNDRQYDRGSWKDRAGRKKGPPLWPPTGSYEFPSASYLSRSHCDQHVNHASPAVGMWSSQPPICGNIRDSWDYARDARPDLAAWDPKLKSSPVSSYLNPIERDLGFMKANVAWPKECRAAEAEYEISGPTATEIASTSTATGAGDCDLLGGEPCGPSHEHIRSEQEATPRPSKYNLFDTTPVVHPRLFTNAKYNDEDPLEKSKRATQLATGTSSLLFRPNGTRESTGLHGDRPTPPGRPYPTKACKDKTATHGNRQGSGLRVPYGYTDPDKGRRGLKPPPHSLDYGDVPVIIVKDNAEAPKATSPAEESIPNTMEPIKSPPASSPTQTTMPSIADLELSPAVTSFPLIQATRVQAAVDATQARQDPMNRPTALSAVIHRPATTHQLPPRPPTSVAQSPAMAHQLPPRPPRRVPSKDPNGRTLRSYEDTNDSESEAETKEVEMSKVTPSTSSPEAAIASQGQAPAADVGIAEKTSPQAALETTEAEIKSETVSQPGAKPADRDDPRLQPGHQGAYRETGYPGLFYDSDSYDENEKRAGALGYGIRKELKIPAPSAAVDSELEEGQIDETIGAGRKSSAGLMGSHHAAKGEPRRAKDLDERKYDFWQSLRTDGEAKRIKAGMAIHGGYRGEIDLKGLEEEL